MTGSAPPALLLMPVWPRNSRHAPRTRLGQSSRRSSSIAMRQPALVFSGSISLRIGKTAYEIALKSSDIELVPFEVMCGRS
jgi:hypothetical protein